MTHRRTQRVLRKMQTERPGVGILFSKRCNLPVPRMGRHVKWNGRVTGGLLRWLRGMSTRYVWRTLEARQTTTSGFLSMNGALASAQCRILPWMTEEEAAKEFEAEEELALAQQQHHQQ